MSRRNSSSPKQSTPSSERAELAEQAEKWGAFILANILWAILSIPLITMPAATAGLFNYMSARVRGLQPDFFRVFFEGIRLHWRKATVIGLIDVLVGGLIVLNTSIFPYMDVQSDPIAFLSRSVTIFAALALLLINLYAWSLMVLLQSLTIRQILVNAAVLVVTHPLWSIVVLIASALPVVISLFLPRGIFVIVTASACALITCMGTWRVIRQHLTPTQLR